MLIQLALSASPDTLWSTEYVSKMFINAFKLIIKATAYNVLQTSNLLKDIALQLAAVHTVYRHIFASHVSQAMFSTVRYAN
jgi:hypothetical protein